MDWTQEDHLQDGTAPQVHRKQASEADIVHAEQAKLGNILKRVGSGELE